MCAVVLLWHVRTMLTLTPMTAASVCVQKGLEALCVINPDPLTQEVLMQQPTFKNLSFDIMQYVWPVNNVHINQRVLNLFPQDCKIIDSESGSTQSSNSSIITAKQTEICIKTRGYDDDVGRGKYLKGDNCHYIIKVGVLMWSLMLIFLNWIVLPLVN